jgi:hypothetical protein
LFRGLSDAASEMLQPETVKQWHERGGVKPAALLDLAERCSP